MSKKLTPEEAEARGKVRDELIKHVFDNLRNTIICVTLFFAGLAFYGHSADLPLSPNINRFIGALIGGLAAFLFAWNMIHGGEKVIRPIKNARTKWLFLPLIATYLLLIFAIFGALSIMNFEQQSRPAAISKPVPNKSAECGNP
ncbi:MAG: hypothetical protein ABL933_16850 [Methyloglobulus sp.]|nr:hypothetical protein [Methyloglobulus sp.]